MSSSYTIAETQTFTITHAKHIAAKVAADLKRLQRFYGQPSDTSIADYETEVIALLKGGYLDTVWYGFRRDGEFIEPTIKYAASDLTGAEDNDPGRIRPNANIDGASFYSYLTYSPSWDNLSDEEKKDFKDRLPFQRTSASEPGVNGYLLGDLTYSSGGRALNRSSLRSY